MTHPDKIRLIDELIKDGGTIADYICAVAEIDAEVARISSAGIYYQKSDGRWVVRDKDAADFNKWHSGPIGRTG